MVSAQRKMHVPWHRYVTGTLKVIGGTIVVILAIFVLPIAFYILMP